MKRINTSDLVIIVLVLAAVLFIVWQSAQYNELVADYNEVVQKVNECQAQLEPPMPGMGDQPIDIQPIGWISPELDD